MDKDVFVRRSASAATNAMKYSFGEGMRQRASQPLPKRLAKVAFGKTVRHFIPESLRLQGQNYSLINGGGEQLVYSNGDEVVKVIYNSLTFDRSKAKSQTEQYEQQYYMAASSLGEHFVTTAFDTRRMRAGLFATVALQPYLNPDKQFRDIGELVTYRSDELYLERLKHLSAALRGLYLSAGMQMDLNGPNNILLMDEMSNSNFRIVDTLPVTPEIQRLVHPELNRTIGEIILAKMAMIEAATEAPSQFAESREVVLH